MQSIQEISMKTILTLMILGGLFLAGDRGAHAQPSAVPLSTFSTGYGEFNGTVNDVRGLVGQPAPGRTSGSGNVVHSGFIPGALLASGTVGVPIAHQEIPEVFDLAQNYPNPFNPFTTIKYQLPVDGRVTISVFDILGREVITLINGPVKAGRHVVMWTGTNSAGNSVSSGFYLYRILAKPERGGEPYLAIRKMILLK
jgi:hypothetical protein